MKKKFLALFVTTLCLTMTVLPQTVDAACWKQDHTGWWYQEDNGSYPKNQWKFLNGRWFWFDSNGYMATGWRKINNSWFYFDSNGCMADYGWNQINGSWYYMKKDGSMTGSGWHKIGGSYYYFDVNGNMATGWKKLNGTWYYLKSDGTMMRNGWLKIKGKWYYFDSDGAMAGKGWHKINGNYYYMYSSGEMAADAWIDGYYVNASGTWIPNKTRSYKAAYAQFLRQKGYQTEVSDSSSLRFIVRDIGGDNIPELIIIPNKNHLSGGQIYTYTNNSGVVYAGHVFGLYGSISFRPSVGLIDSGYQHMGNGLDEFFALENGKLVSKARWTKCYIEGEKWYLNNVSTTKKNYENWAVKNLTGKIESVGYDNMYEITEKNIHDCLE